MSYLKALPANTALQTIPDMLLADTAIRIQLTPTHHDLAVTRYEAINDWLDRPESPLCGRVALMYPQGSMAIGATIASKLRTDEFDIDIIAELAIRADADPEAVLNLLYRSIRGERGSRYYSDLQRFIGKMAFLAEGNCDLPEMRDVMAELFGENPTGAVFKSFTERLGQISGGGRSVYQPRTSHLDLAKSGLAAPVTVPSRQVATTPRHNFFGRSRE